MVDDETLTECRELTLPPHVYVVVMQVSLLHCHIMSHAVQYFRSYKEF